MEYLWLKCHCLQETLKWFPKNTCLTHMHIYLYIHTYISNDCVCLCIKYNSKREKTCKILTIDEYLSELFMDLSEGFMSKGLLSKGLWLVIVLLQFFCGFEFF